MTLEPNQPEGGLDQGVRELRELQVDPALVANHSDVFFASFDRHTSAAKAGPAKSWWHLPGGMAAAAAVAVVLTLRFHGNPSVPADQVKVPSEDVVLVETPPPDDRLVELGDRVAMIAQPTSIYVIESVSVSQAKLRVLTGAVTVRLFRETDAPYDLAVSAGEYTFAAMGTIYTVTHDNGGPALTVHEGEVWVRDGEGELVGTLSAGESWPEGSETIAGAEVERLGKHALSMQRPTLEGEGSSRNAAAPRKDSPPSPARTTVPESLPQKWQRARLLRGQSKPAEALSVLKELATSQDTTWAPLAVIEQIRIHRESPAGLANRSNDILRLGREFSESWRDHPLSDEVTAMVCPLLKGQSEPPMALCQSDE